MQSLGGLFTYVVMWSIADESLLASMGAGDEEAAAAFVRRFQGRVFGLALTIVRDPQTAEEVAQETFLKAWKHASVFDPRRGRVATWLLTIARNLAIDVVRVRRQDPMDPHVLATLQDNDLDPGPDEAHFLIDDTQRLRSALADLPEDQKRALVLAAFYGRTAREISELEDAPLGTIKTRIRTAMIKLRSALEVSDDR
ncbi:MAG: RNA polymerase sigma factor [Actinomycetota bacterium]